MLHKATHHKRWCLSPSRHFGDMLQKWYHHFYGAMHFSAKRGLEIACRLSVRPSVCDVDGL